MTTLSNLLEQSCQTDSQALDARRVSELLALLPDWELVPVPADTAGKAGVSAIECCFRFKDYPHTMGFVNAVADLATTQDHHPTLVVDFKRCLVRFTTHAANAGRGGLSLNDFICAAKVRRLFEQGASVHE